MNIASIKESITITQVSDIFGLEITTGKSKCPRCGSEKFSTKKNKTYKCYKCGINGSVIDLVIDIGQAKDVSSAIALLSPHGEVHQINQNVYRQCGMEKVYNLLLRDHEVLDDFVKARGWTAKVKDSLRYYPHKRYLRSQGCSKEELTELNLMSDDGEEYYDGYIIFPVRNYINRIVHFCGRAVKPDAYLRWKHTKGSPGINDYLYNENLLNDRSLTSLILCEGVTDCMSLMSLGYNALAMFGINAPLLIHKSSFKHLTELTAIFDTDKYPIGTTGRLSGKYKSWSMVLPILIELQIALPELTITCGLLPNWAGVKDINELLIETEHNEETFCNAVTLVQLSVFACEILLPEIESHYLLWKLASMKGQSVLEAKLRRHVELIYNSDFVAYQKEVFKSIHV